MQQLAPAAASAAMTANHTKPVLKNIGGTRDYGQNSAFNAQLMPSFQDMHSNTMHE